MGSDPVVAGASWHRADWAAHADRLLRGAFVHRSPSGARVLIPGAEGGYGADVDGLEGFARTFLIAGFRIAGERGRGVDALLEHCRRAVTAGVDPANPERWLLLTEHPQAKVEAASIALVLDLTREWLWDTLDARTQQRLVDYLSPVVGDRTYPPTNWLWFRIVVQTFLRSVGGPWSADDIADDLALHDSLVRADGWISDGPERSFDHYVGWALQLYPVLWSRMSGAAELVGDRPAVDRLRLDRFLSDALCLVGADGAPLVQGRSLSYRFAAAAPFWAGVFAEVPSHSPGRLRTAAELIVRHFVDRGVPDADDLLSTGWHRPWAPLAQSYSGPGSPYWAAKGLLGLVLPAEHPVWSAPAEALPVQTADQLRVVRSPGWIVSGTRADGIVRIINHGTDHALPGSHDGDSPLYTRYGYSTVTSPLLDQRAWRDPLEQSVVLLDEQGRGTHRAGMELLEVRSPESHGAPALALSRATLHWLSAQEAVRNHGSGLTGTARQAAVQTVLSLVRGPSEIRVVWTDAAEGVAPGAARPRMRWGGWPLPVATDDRGTSLVDERAVGGTAQVRSGQLVSILQVIETAGPQGIPALDPGVCARVEHRIAASPLAHTTAVPVVVHDLPGDRPVAACLTLTGDDTAAAAAAAAAAVELTDVGTVAESDVARHLRITVGWPDGHLTTTDLHLPTPPSP